jgi:hypothetical protein
MPKRNQVLAPLDVSQRYSTREAGAYLRICQATLYKQIAAGLLHVIREGKRTYIPGSEIARRSALPQ